MVVVRRVLHGLGDPGGVGCAACAGPSPELPAGTVDPPPLLAFTGTVGLPLDGEVPAVLPY